MGHVNNAVFLTFLEQCRLMFWQTLTGTGSPGSGIILARVECDYRAPAYFRDVLEVRLNVGSIGRSSFALNHEIVNLATGKQLAEAKTILVAYDYSAGRSIPIPPETRTLLESVQSGGWAR
jgi:acyl-CoA thioester hydrolase